MPDAIARARAALGGDFVRHGAVLFVSTTLINVFGYAFHFAISRKIGVVRYGELSALNAAFMLSLVVPAIVSTVIVKYAAEFHAAGDGARLATLTRRLVRYAGIGGLLALALLLASVGPIGAFLNVDDPLAVALAVAMIACSMAVAAIRGLLQGTESFNWLAVSVILESLLKLVLGVGAVYAGYGVVGAFGGWALGSFVAFVVTATVLLRGVRGAPRAPLDLHLGRLATTMTGVAAATVLLAALANVDVLVVKHFADPTTAGLYGALSLAGKILLFLVSFVPMIVLPKATRRALSGERPSGILLQALGVSAAMSIPGLIFYFFEPGLVVTMLAGAAFAPAGPYVFAYGCAMVVLAVLNVVVAYKIGIHRFDFVVPLAACTVGEIAGISFLHRTLGDVIAVLIAGNILAVAVSAWRITAPAPGVAFTAAPDAA